MSDEPTSTSPSEPPAADLPSESAPTSAEVVLETQPPATSEPAAAPPPVEPSVSAPPEPEIPSSVIPSSEVEPPKEELVATDVIQDASPTNPVPPPSTNNSASIPIVDAAARARAYARAVAKREARLTRIVEFVQKEGAIGNDDIVRLLHVSRASASRYARALVSRGLLRLEGRGRARKYRLPH